MLPPPALLLSVIAALRAAGDTTPIKGLQPVPSGAESHAVRLTTRRDSYFLKWSKRARPGRYTVEAQGLALLRETGTVRVPQVLAVAEPQEGQPGFFLQEWLDRPPGELHLKRAGRGLGAQLAALHRCDTFWNTAVPGYTFDHPLDETGGFQAAGWEQDWVRLFRERCLRPQVERAAGKGWLTPERRRRLERVIERLDELLGGVEHRPSLLHGDLHPGNVLCDRTGKPVLVDPLPSFADRELELAHTERMGRLPPVFYDAYREVWPLAPGYARRRDIYLLSFMLGHHGCGSIGDAAAADMIAYRYVGA
ncbi:MAG TPA: fructosamine kinase family protein [Chloroflexota bacterium]|jgi:protein-ribulosamine 3-kinase|nr:fructosamine kinase family protein [Chloroflexota bacterium]